MTHPSVIDLVGILQTFGLSRELLTLLAEHCQRKQTGGISLYTSQGRIVKYEVRACGTVADERSGTGSEPVVYVRDERGYTVPGRASERDPGSRQD